jgi:hypothetical protein
VESDVPAGGISPIESRPPRADISGEASPVGGEASPMSSITNNGADVFNSAIEGKLAADDYGPPGSPHSSAILWLEAAVAGP